MVLVLKRAKAVVKVWDGETIAANAVSKEVGVFGYDRKTVYFIADAAGNLTIEVSDPAGGWRAYDTVPATANELLVYTLTSAVTALRLRYDTAATVTAWVVVECP